jgi:hypothetical protein
MEMVRTFVVLVAVFAAVATASAEGWRTIKTRDVCADGSRFSFQVRRGSTDKLLVFFNGGGACWTAETCDPAKGEAVYLSSVASKFNDVGNWDGIFNTARADNPFRDWSMVFVPYCTGDVHLGARNVTYALGGKKITVRHNGYANARAAIRWTFERHPAPKTVLVAGGSAGAIAAPFYAGMFVYQYPRARVSVLGDGAGAYRSAAVPKMMSGWGVDAVRPLWLRQMGDVPLYVETYFKANAAFPKLRQSEFNDAQDAAQGMFLKLMGESGAVEPFLRANLDDLRHAVPGFRSYVAPGAEHTALRYARFYETKVAGVPLPRWAADFAEGRPIADVDCNADTGGCVGPK